MIYINVCNYVKKMNLSSQAYKYLKTTADFMEYYERENNTDNRH